MYKQIKNTGAFILKITNLKKLSEKYERFRQNLYRHSEVQLRDDESATVSGARKIITCSAEEIRLEIAKNIIGFSGDNLKMNNFGSDAVQINGKISSITYEVKK